MSTTTGKIQYITDENNGIVLPVTHERGVVDSSGVNLQTKLAQKVDSADIDNVVELTQAQYDALSTKDSRTMYITTDSTVPSDHVGVASIVQTTTSSADGGTNVVTCTLTNNQTSTFQIKNGNQGNSGYTGAAGELEVVNNLTDGGSTAALSAEMGKTLEGEISQLGLYVNNNDYIRVVVDAESKLIEAIKTDGTKVYFVPVELSEANIAGNNVVNADSQEFIMVEVDENGAILGGYKKDGDAYFGCGVPSQIKEYIDNTFDRIGSGNPINSDILYLNPREEVFPKLSNLRRDTTKANDLSSSKVLSILHFSDLHLDNDNLLRIKEFYDNYRGYIDEVIQTGDINNQLSNGMPSAYAQTTFILNVVGNHDSTLLVGTPPNHSWVTQSTKDTYDYLIKPYVHNWGGVVQPTGADANGYCYYYKDYSAKKIRLIVLDNMPSLGGGPAHWDATQKTWFEGVLADTLDSSNSAYGYHVVVALHYPPFVIDQTASNPFTTEGYTTYPSYYAPSDIANSVKTFINNGGIFACYLCGHLHSDFFGFGRSADGFQNQFAMSINCAGVVPADSYSNQQRTVGEKTQDCFDIVGIDADSSLVKVIRIGADYDNRMKRRDTLCVDYSQSVIVYPN